MLLPAPMDGAPSAYAWPAALFVWGPGSWSDLHRHHCVQLVMTLGGQLRYRTGRRQRWTTCEAVLVRPDAWHEVNARGTIVMIGFVDPEGELASALLEHTTSDVAPLDGGTIARWRIQLGDPASVTEERVSRWVTGALLRDKRPPHLDPRIKRVLRALPGRLADAEAVSLEALAALVRLSPSRFMHLFTASLGVPVRPYILWLRLQYGARELAQGRSVAEAAHAAGFADAAHFTRTFRRMIGATPRQVLRHGLAARDFHV